MLPPGLETLLEKTAFDSGFDRELAREGEWLRFANSHSPLVLGLTVFGDSLFLAAFSQHNVLAALTDFGTAFTSPLPQGAAGARAVTSLDHLLSLVKRAMVLSRTLPNELLHKFEAASAGLPRATEAEQLIVRRVGQDVFRKGLLEYWEHRCAVTSLAVPELLRASHIKPWAACPTDAERLDVFNGLLLAPHLDAAFDGGFITFNPQGGVVVSARLSEEARGVLALHESLKIMGLTERHHSYLRWHRERLFTPT